MVEAFSILREPRRPGAHRGPVPAADGEAFCRSTATGTPTSSAALEKAAYELGLGSVASGPLVRSSYHADEQLPAAASAS